MVWLFSQRCGKVISMTSTLTLNLPAVKPQDSAAFIETWFDAGDLVAVYLKRSGEHLSKEQNVYSQFIESRTLAHDMRSDDGYHDLYNICSDPPSDVYIGVNLSDEVDARRRATNKDIKSVLGVAADLDVKEGGFKDTEQILDMLRGLEILPTCVVESGSGGVHAWWRFTEPVSPEAGKELMSRWWSHLNLQASERGASVDKLTDIARMLRLPGSLRWPRKSDEGSVGVVTLRYAAGPSQGRTEATRFLDVSNDAWKLQLKRRSNVRNTERVLFSSSGVGASTGKWADLRRYAGIEDWFNEHVSWDFILENAGWNFIKVDGAGRSEWGRPGRMEKSAVVDWPESPLVMSLLSTSDRTNLLDLLDAEVVLTKWRVCLRLLFNDDLRKMEAWVMTGMKNEEERGGA